MVEFERITLESAMEAHGFLAEQTEAVVADINEQIELMKNNPKEWKRRQQEVIDVSEERDRRFAAEGKKVVLQTKAA